MSSVQQVSHIHISFIEYEAAIHWFESILGVMPISKSESITLFKFENLEIAVHPNWGDGDTAFTLAFNSSDCVNDYNNIIKRGAKPRTPPRSKGDTIGADVFGPGKVVIEFEQI